MTKPKIEAGRCTARTARARTAVHRFAMPGMGFRPVHGLLGIFEINYKNSQQVAPWSDLLPAKNRETFLKKSVRAVHRPEIHAGQGFPANGRVNGGSGVWPRTDQIWHFSAWVSAGLAGSPGVSPSRHYCRHPVAPPRVNLRPPAPSICPKSRQCPARANANIRKRK
jgi:hypothetical protein